MWTTGFGVILSYGIQYQQYYADGTSRVLRRLKKQGAPAKPLECRKVYKTYTMTKQSLPIILEKAKSMNMSVSAYIELAAVLYNPIKD